MIMRVYNDDNKFVKIIELNTIRFSLTKKVDNSLKQETNFIIKHNGILVEHTTKNGISQSLSKYRHRTDIHKHQKQ